ncbi:MAG: hypothetical protein A2Y69_11170 [Candidatus Aminicenantes bacterium RBG_13_59_9]|nr:MAG: hypothetical protein A2Y69_11170 [Candidatus Aminicenantes bacterium RBG_13_59_9]
MDNENSTTRIGEDDLSFIEKELGQTKRPFSIKELAEKLAFQKTASQRIQDVLKYDPACLYQVGNQIYKEYNESLTVSSRQVEHFEGAVVLKVVNKVFYKGFNCEMIEVDYAGGGLFRRYIDYMKKTKTQVLIPSNCDGLARTPEKMERGEDPRLTGLPMADKDIKSIERNLKTAIPKSHKFFSWNDRWQLVENEVSIPEDKIKEIEAHLKETSVAASTGSLVTKSFGLEPSHSLYDIHCLSLNFVLEKKYKKEFLFVSDVGWGKWHLKAAVGAMLENLPLSAAAARFPELVGDEKPELSAGLEFPLKIYLTWREVASGAIKIPKSLHKELAHSREYIFTDADEAKSYTVYYFPVQGFFLGLKDYFDSHNIPQGTSLTLERKAPNAFNFWIKKSKKKMATVKLGYETKDDLFAGPGEDVFTYAMPNKIIYLERDILAKLISLAGQRNDLDLRELLVMVFKNFGQDGADRSLHYLRAYHMVDLFRQTSQEEVEAVLLNSTEFIKSEKKKGIFYYREPVLPAKEEKIHLPEEAEIAIEALPGEIPVSEIPTGLEAGEELEEEEKIEIPPQVLAAETIEKAAAAKKEKPAKKKKLKLEGEKAPRAKKSERRIIEEQIQLEESEQEALSAIKEKELEPERVEHRAGEKKEEVKPAAAKLPSFGGLFAEKLKVALKKKEEPKKEDAEPKKEEPAEEKS